jgi:putative hydrolase of the HAD superfamily
MGVGGVIRAVLLDALGTLLELRPPAPALRAELAARGIEVDGPTAERAFGREIAYYRAHLLDGRDRRSLADLRRRCALVLRDALGVPAPVEDVEAAMLASLRFAAYPDVPGALERLRAGGRRLVVASNWDVSLHDRLAEAGIAARVDGAVASAQVGAAKPDPRVFARALKLASVAPGEALHAGDSPHEDVEGARAAGIEAVLVARGARAPRSLGVPVVASLHELADLVLSDRRRTRDP